MNRLIYSKGEERTLSTVKMLPLFIIVMLLSASKGKGEQRALFIFGDSLYDNGNNDYINTTFEFQANFWPYGLDFNSPTGRFSNGRLVSDFMAEYLNLPMIGPYLRPGHDDDLIFGANFASGGAGALREVNQGMVISPETQVTYFKRVKKHLMERLGEGEAEELLENSLYLVNFGGNDYMTSYGVKSSIFYEFSEQQLVDIVIGNITATIKEIYKEGGRRFGFHTLAPLGCWPSTRVNEVNGKCRENITAIVKLHNSKFAKRMNEMEKQLKGFRYSIFDSFTFISQRMKNPSKFGMAEGQTACCGSGAYRGVYSCGGKRGVKEFELCKNRSQYLFFDSNHPTETVYRQMATLMWYGDSSHSAPNNLNSLFKAFPLHTVY